MSARNALCLMLLVAAASLPVGCDWHLPGKPIKPVPETLDSKADFERLYFVQCLGCHGPQGLDGPARPMHDPLYLALIPTKTLETVISEGHGILMPGFKRTLAGGLTEEEIAALAAGMKHFWGDPDKAGKDLPSYAQANGAGNADAGKKTFATFCGDCHGADGTGLEDGAGSVVDNRYLLLVSDQALRSTVICGRLDLGCPSFRGPFKGQPEGRALSNSEIDDVTAWLVSNRRTIAEEAAQ